MIPNGEITVLVASGDDFLREGLKSVFRRTTGIRFVGEASSAHQAVDMCLVLKPHIVVMDVVVYGDETAGVEATRQIVKQLPETKVVAVSHFEKFLSSARGAGARGAFKLGDSSSSKINLVNLIRHVHQSKHFGVGRDNGSGKDEEPLVEELTPRENEVMRLLVDGNAVREIARDLGIAPCTVKNHVQSIYGKLQVGNRAGAVRKAIRSGLVRLE